MAIELLLTQIFESLWKKIMNFEFIVSYVENTV